MIAATFLHTLGGAIIDAGGGVLALCALAALVAGLTRWGER